MSPSARHVHGGKTLDEMARKYRVRRRLELDRNLDSPDGLRKLVDSLIGDVWRARREKAAAYDAWAKDLDARGVTPTSEPLPSKENLL